MIFRNRQRFGQRRQRQNSLQLETLENRVVLDSTVVFNEVMYNPVGETDGQTEWIELFNQLKVDMDISEWVLTGGVDYTFPDGTIVPGRGHLVVAANPTALQEAGDFQGAFGPWKGQLSNSGESLQLFNNDNRLMNRVDYEHSNGWPNAADGTGSSLSKADQFAGSHLVESWTFSQQVGGTPGFDNFIAPGAYRATNVIGEGVPVTVHVPASDALGLSWTQANFDDGSWTTGNLGVGHDSSRKPSYTTFLGLDLNDPPKGQAALPFEDVTGSVYIRLPFQSADAQFDRIRLQMRYDDGFVAYLNGVEVASANAPGRDGDAGELAWDSVATASHRDRDAQVYETFDITAQADILKEGDNLLAIHGMNQLITGNDSLFDLLLSGDTLLIPPVVIPLEFNEFAAADAEEFFVEISADGDQAIDLKGLVLASTAGKRPDYVFGDSQLSAGDLLVVTSQQLGYTPDEGERIVLYSGDRTNVIDARRVTGRLRGRSERHEGEWLYPSVATPAGANAFVFQEDVVINEIMYHPHPQLNVPDMPPQYDRENIVSMNDEWRYNASGIRLGSDWAQQAYTAGEEGWLQGAGLLGAETATLAFPINTEFPRPSTNDPSFATYYFQAEFELTADEAASTELVEMNHMVDDGAIIYLNGQEISRFNLPAEVTADTFAPSSIRNAELVGPTAVSANLLKVGKNTLSAEVHVRNANDSDIVFGASLMRATKTADLIPGSSFREIIEGEWLELYNKGATAIDLSGWEIDGGIKYQFPSGTRMQAGEYLVVAKDADYLSEKYNDIRIIGNYSGRLSDHDDRILLLDTNKNPADDVHYYEGGTWPAYPDGGGVSLELTNPNADNSKGTVWASSDDSSESEWTSHTYRDTARLDIYGRPLFDEFLFGLLGAGEFLIDDVEVLKDPAGQAIPLMQNGTFDEDAIGSAPDKWRLIGNHSGVVVTDPTDAQNQVLHVTATGAMAYVHDHAETTFANREDIDDGVDYEISFRAKWVAGSSQLNNRLWFNRLSNTIRLDLPERSGSPGVQNTSFEANVGPVYADLQHHPVTPAENQEVTVQVSAADVDDVASVKLFWRKDGENWNTVEMEVGAEQRSLNPMYSAVIPGHSSGDIIQFYVEARDGQDAASMYPASGPESRALFQVDDGRGPMTEIDRFRMIMMELDNKDMFRSYNLMSNAVRGITLVHNDTVFYDVGARMIGSRFIRPNSGYKIRLSPEQPFYGVHDSIRFDIDGLREIVLKQMLNRTGGSKASQYDDIGYLLSANRAHSHEFLLQLARYENLYLNEQFEDGSDGTKFEMDDVTVPNGGGFERLKTGTDVNTGQDIGGTGTSLQDQRDNPEFYRGHLLIKSNRAKDDYQAMVRLAQAIHTNGMELFERTNEVMDVDLWMRHYAHQSYFGAWDTYGFGRPKNLRMYVRPADNKVIPLMWDCDRCPMDREIKQGVGVSRLDEIRDIPHNLRVYWGHIYDFMNTSFTEEYTAKWAAHYGALAAGRSHGADGDFTEVVGKARNRIREATRDLERDIPKVDFKITTNNGRDLQVDSPSILLEGKGWVDIRSMRLVGTDQPLKNVFWPESDSWQVEIPLATGANPIAIEAIDFRGNLISVESINVESSVGDPIGNSLRVTEVHYNPSSPTARELSEGYEDSDDFEFIELANVGAEAISLSEVSLSKVTRDAEEQGVSFRFADGSVAELLPGETVLVVEDLDAFQFRFGNTLPIAGQWSGGLGNGGEMITVENSGVLVQQFAYDDAWHPTTDGQGRSLQIVNSRNADLGSWSNGWSWHPSNQMNGSPGVVDPTPGDSNGDGIFNSIDLMSALQAGEYEDGIVGNSTMAEGDWDGDGDFTTSDFVWAFRFGSYTAERAAASRSIEQETLVGLTSDYLQGDLQTTSDEPKSRSRQPVIDSPSALQQQRVHLDHWKIDSVFDRGVTEVQADSVDRVLGKILDEDDLV
ncbi:MAG: lamin tail domain-containing protein [Pirellulaceae bacterium]|nr:lamin tail domain-containing protein [Pirellulaceae bacterium]